MSEETYYDFLGVKPDADVQEIESAYKRLVKQTHPDLGGSSSLFRQVREAWETLSDPVKRGHYDFLLASGRQEASFFQSDSRSDHGGQYAAWEDNEAFFAKGTAAHAPDHPQRFRGDVLGRFVSTHPWMVPLVLGYLASLVEPAVGFVLFLVGFTALIGTRRARAKFAGCCGDQHRSRISYGLHLFWEEFLAGVKISIVVLGSIIAVLEVRSLLAGRRRVS